MTSKEKIRILKHMVSSQILTSKDTTHNINLGNIVYYACRFLLFNERAVEIMMESVKSNDVSIKPTSVKPHHLAMDLLNAKKARYFKVNLELFYVYCSVTTSGEVLSWFNLQYVEGADQVRILYPDGYHKPQENCDIISGLAEYGVILTVPRKHNSRINLKPYQMITMPYNYKKDIYKVFPFDKDEII